MLTSETKLQKAWGEGGRERGRDKANRLIWITSTVTPSWLYEHRTGVCNSLAKLSSAETGINLRCCSTTSCFSLGSWPSASLLSLIVRMTSHSGNFSASSLTSPNASYSWRRECSPSPSPHSSRDGACSSPTMGEASKKSFSSSSLTGHGYYYTYPKVSFNKDLLTPLHLDVDPALQEIRIKEKEDIKMLNDQFAALIGKVRWSCSLSWAEDSLVMMYHEEMGG